MIQHCATGLFKLAVNFILFMSRSRCGLTTSARRRAKQGAYRPGQLGGVAAGNSDIGGADAQQQHNKM